MPASGRELLAAFDALGLCEKRQVAAEILRRSAGVGDVPPETFEELAVEVLRSYDAQEAAGAEH